MITNSFQDLCNKLLCWHIPLVQRIGTHAQKPWLEFLSSLGRGQVQENIFLFPDDICFLSLIKATGVATTWHTEGSTVKATSCSWTHGNVFFFFFPDTLRLEDYKIRLKLICHFGESLLKLNHSERGWCPRGVSTLSLRRGRSKVDTPAEAWEAHPLTKCHPQSWHLQGTSNWNSLLKPWTKPPTES